MPTDKIAALRNTSLFGELDEKTLRALAERAVERAYARDEVLFLAGEEARGLFCIAEGAVRAFNTTASSDSKADDSPSPTRRPSRHSRAKT